MTSSAVASLDPLKNVHATGFRAASAVSGAIWGADATAGGRSPGAVMRRREGMVENPLFRTGKRAESLCPWANNENSHPLF